MNRQIMLRRRILAGLAGTALLPAAAGAARLMRTPSQTEGPFYPQKQHRAADEDSDLLTIRGRDGRVAGEIIYVTGQVMRPDRSPIANARVEIWQANIEGVYNHPSDGRDETFQGYGSAQTDANGRYAFRTIKPGGYGTVFFSRTPHIHFKIGAPGEAALTTQMYFAGDPQNERDGILNSIRDPESRARLIVDFHPTPSLEPDSRSGLFDIVLG